MRKKVKVWQVFKFGGASVKDAAGIKNAGKILNHYAMDTTLVVVSALGKTTDALEKILALSLQGQDCTAAIEALRQQHLNVARDLFEPGHAAFDTINRRFDGLPGALAAKGAYNFLYDSVVSVGELVSTDLVYFHLFHAGASVHRLDAREVIRTDSTFREGRVRWRETEKNGAEAARLFADHRWVITQGFIGRNDKGETTTLGRDGSDYSAAIFASVLGVESVTIWKDVPGVMSADPKRLPAATVFEQLPYQEAAEMTYYGASVIHPKTIKPLANRNIPLYVKSFVNPELPGTLICAGRVAHIPPLVVFKDGQCLISCRVTDYSFVTEEQLGLIFSILSRLGVKINLMQNSAISFSFCTDFEEQKVLPLIEELSQHFEVFYNTPLTLITVKNYDAATQTKYRSLPGVVLEQSSRSTLQVLVKEV
jgi:aspartate kinase